jgi:hypothetical protein
VKEDAAAEEEMTREQTRWDADMATTRWAMEQYEGQDVRIRCMGGIRQARRHEALIARRTSTRVAPPTRQAEARPSRSRPATQDFE